MLLFRKNKPAVIICQLRFTVLRVGFGERRDAWKWIKVMQEIRRNFINFPANPLDMFDAFILLKHGSMKKFIFSVFICSLFFYQQISAQELKTEFLLDLELSLNPPQVVGPVLKGTRVIFPFKDGVVKGDKINGIILESGADWGLVLDSTTFKIDVRTTIQTDDGALIFMTYSGYNYANAKNFAMISAGKGGELSPSDYYFRTSVYFETSSPKYAWLNRTVAIGVGRFSVSGKVNYRIYAVK
jgi:hypothetical protein